MLEEQTHFRQNEIKAKMEQGDKQAEQEAIRTEEAECRKLETAHLKSERKRSAILRKTLIDQDAARAI